MTDPSGSDAVVAAGVWLEAAMTGTAATIVAVLAVAALGFLMLSGRIDWRRGATVLLGCFILFGAASIAAGLQGIGASRVDSRGSAAPAVPPTVSSPQFDPYAGAAPARQ